MRNCIRCSFISKVVTQKERVLRKYKSFMKSVQKFAKEEKLE